MPSLPEVTLEMENDGSPGVATTDEAEKQEGEKDGTGECITCCGLIWTSFNYANCDRFRILFRWGRDNEKGWDWIEDAEGSADWFHRHAHNPHQQFNETLQVRLSKTARGEREGKDTPSSEAESFDMM